MSKKALPFFTLRSRSEKESIQIALALGKKLKPGNVVALTGEIGSGKTVFIKGLARGLGVRHSREVKSPTFVLLHLYEGRMPIYHFDLYRLKQPSELDAIGFEEFLSNPEAVSLVEWADRAKQKIPARAIWVHLKIKGHTTREITTTQ